MVTTPQGFKKRTKEFALRDMRLAEGLPKFTSGPVAGKRPPTVKEQWSIGERIEP